MNAFAARLTDEEARGVAELDGVVSVFPSGVSKIHTTRSWDFLGLPQIFPNNRTSESDVIVGIMDTGVDPTSASFDDRGFGPPPAKWKGGCAFSGNKLIGAKWFRLDHNVTESDVLSPLDMIGHGTHIASTIAGVPVAGANLFGMATGTARGGVPSARIAVYKVCFDEGFCFDHDMLAAFDAAIADGVDIINLSTGGIPSKTFTDTHAICAYHAMRRGVLVVTSAGNFGPMRRSVVNYSPWMLTVGASSVDRQFGADLVLGNGQRFTGVSVNTFDSDKQFLPLMLAVSATKLGMNMNAQMCMPDSLEPELVTGKIVVCKVTGAAAFADGTVKDAGGAGVVIHMSVPVDKAEAFKLPATMMSKDDGLAIRNYIVGNAGEAVAKIEKSHAYHINGTFIPSFSSRGPNPLYTQILKPDLVAPGLNILSAYPHYISFTGEPTDTRRASYQIMSGTSMATPHVTAAAAYVKSFHPRWSPAAIRSALMTTAAEITGVAGNHKDLEYAYGAGQVNPVRAVDPGLVYEAGESSYLRFMCTKYPNTTVIAIITGSSSFDCQKFAGAKGYDGLNYPSFHYVVPDSRQPSAAVYRRVVENVGAGPAVYTAKVAAPAGVEIVVAPATLEFKRRREIKAFSVEVRVAAVEGRPPYVASGALTWSDGVHSVRSPVVIHYS
ncbi:Xylem serine proteinase 1 [Apostasia shenzhenica]|uniref:Xylem serine proteinase 1 n=1 Tax=Apostasia shenzhenica TaxID=1088818 RepID=A0A2I0AJT9_9ASPA|nr:Xylem serine proteinase 1 [Apostasia shenzhenica]